MACLLGAKNLATIAPMKKDPFIFTLLFLSLTSFGNNPFSPGARSAALGNASLTLCDAWSTVQNQAGLAFIPGISTGVYYENRFLLRELSSRSAVLAIPIKVGTIGISFTDFGYALYQEKKYTVAFAKAFSNVFSLGMALNYHRTGIPENDNKLTALSAETGILITLQKNLLLAAHFSNSSSLKPHKQTNEHLPVVMQLGINYSFSSLVSFMLETEKDMSKKALFKAGIEYHPVPALFLRAGICNDPVCSSFGIGLHLKNVQIDLSANYHQTLGITPQLGLNYMFAKKEKTDRDDL